MSHSYQCVFLHIIWTTKRRAHVISDDIKERLYRYIGSLIAKEDVELFVIGGTENHVHMLVRTTGATSVADFVRVIKANSSTFVNRLGKDYFGFRWQTGYAVFSVGASMVRKVCEYIRNQEKHHGKFSLDEEFKALVKKYKIERDSLKRAPTLDGGECSGHGA